MADNVISDLIMKFVLPGGNAIDGESSSDIDLKRPMASGFEKGKMLEVQSFQFRTGIGGEDEESVAQQKQEDAHRQSITDLNAKLKKQHEKHNHPGEPLQLDVPKSSSLGAYGKWREGNDNTKYPVDMAPVEFSRAIDKASAILLRNCIKRVNYESATLIKRKAAGGPASGEIFLRFDFTTVLMTRIDWDNDDPIKEKCQFISRAVTIHYLPQLPDGTLGAAIRRFWTMSPNLSAVDLKR